MRQTIHALRRLTASYRVELIFGLFVFFTHAYFYNGVSWNQNARLDLVYSIVEQNPAGVGTFQIDRFVTDAKSGRNTGDWAIYDGHYYSNKAPGTSFLAVPLYYVLYHFESTLGFDTSSYGWVQFNAYLMNLWVSVFWLALGAAFLVRCLNRLWGQTRTAMIDALLVGAVFSFCTLAFPFDTQFWGHSTVAGMVAIGYSLLFCGTRKTIFLGGLILGLGVLVEYLAFGLLIPAFLYLAIAGHRRKHLLAFVGGVLPALALLLVYQKICFGGYLVTASALTNPIFIKKDHLFSQFGAISWSNLLDMLFSFNRGIFLFMPILIVAVANIRHLLLRRRISLVLICLLSIGGCAFALSRFFGHHGGASTGTRYLILIMPFFCMLLPRWSRLSVGKKYVVGLLSLVSFANMFVIACVNPMIQPGAQKMWTDLLYKPFISGDFPHKTWLPHLIGNPNQEELVLSTFNLGNLVGLSGLPSLIPWFLMAIAGVFFLRQTVLMSNGVPLKALHIDLADEPIVLKCAQIFTSPRWRQLLPLLGIVVLASFLRLQYYDQPNELEFDEFHYVPAAEVLVGLKPHPGLEIWKNTPLIMNSPDVNFSHPPLGKFLIGWSMKIFGNNPMGWRVTSMFTGLLSIIIFYLLALRIFSERRWALLATFLLSTDFLHVVQSRIGMLDMFLFLAGTGLMYCFVRIQEGKNRHMWLVAAAVVSAFGLSVKLPMALCIAGFGLLLLTYGAGSFWVRCRTALIYGGGSLAIFCLWSIYFSFHGYSFSEWVQFLIQTSSSVVGKLKDHRYGSMPAEWLFNGGPVWYYSKSLGAEVAEGIVAMGNPVLWLCFIPSSFLVFAEWRQTRRWQDMLPMVWYLILYFPLFFILWNRQGFIYHMLPAVAPMCLIVARACSLVFKEDEHMDWFVVVTLGVLLFFLPILLGYSIDVNWMRTIQIFTGV